MEDPIGLVTVSCEDKVLISSGVFLTFSSDETKLKIDREDDSLFIILSFKDSKEVKKLILRQN
ncbi:MAG: hypothetical protein ABFS18_12190 [Thermodesulfobacteriota bacterium]